MGEQDGWWGWGAETKLELLLSNPQMSKHQVISTGCLVVLSRCLETTRIGGRDEFLRQTAREKLKNRPQSVSVIGSRWLSPLGCC